MSIAGLLATKSCLPVLLAIGTVEIAGNQAIFDGVDVDGEAMDAVGDVLGLDEGVEGGNRMRRYPQFPQSHLQCSLSTCDFTLT